MVYAIYSRYEYFSKNGIEFTRWFLSSRYNTEDEAKQEMKHRKNTTKEIDKKTKRKHEFEIRYIDETLLPQVAPKRPKGRARKISTEILDDICKRLLRAKSGTIALDFITEYDITPFIFNSDEYKNYITEKVNKKYNGEKWPRFWCDDNHIGYIILKNKEDKLL